MLDAAAEARRSEERTASGRKTEDKAGRSCGAWGKG